MPGLVLASNAATAYLGLERGKPVLQFTGRALDTVDASPSRWSQALARLGMALCRMISDQLVDHRVTKTVTALVSTLR